MKRPLAIDLYCGLGGWTEGLLASGFSVVGIDNERHVYGEHRYPAQLVLQDVRTLHGSQFRDASLIVASSPCQEYSYMAMPWTRAKQIALALLDRGEFPARYTGSRTIAELNELFDQPARIQREASEAAGRWIPMVQENVCGAQPWVGRARWHYGSYYLWGDVPALMPFSGRNAMLHGVAHRSNGETNFHGSAERAQTPSPDFVKVGGLDWNKRIPGQAFNTHAEKATKNTGGSWFNVAHNTTSGSKEQVESPDGLKTIGHVNRRDGHSHTRHLTNQAESDAVKQGGSWFHDSQPGEFRAAAGKSAARKAASARIAKIPFALASHIAHVYFPTSAIEGVA